MIIFREMHLKLWINYALKELGSVWFQIGYIGKKSDWQAHSRDLRGPRSTGHGIRTSTIVAYCSYGPHIICFDVSAKD